MQGQITVLFTVYINNSNGTFTCQRSLAPFVQAVGSLTSADFNHDG